MLIILNQQCTNCLDFLLRINKSGHKSIVFLKRVTSKISQLVHYVTLCLTEGIVNNHQNNSFQLNIPSNPNFCQCWEKCNCKLRKERSCHCDCVVIPSNKEDDEMRQALIALQD